jgi:hypothetical protein
MSKLQFALIPTSSRIGRKITHNDAPLSVGLLWTSDELVAETSTRQHTQQTAMPPAGFETTIAEGERTYALDRAATGTVYKIK